MKVVRHSLLGHWFSFSGHPALPWGAVLRTSCSTASLPAPSWLVSLALAAGLDLELRQGCYPCLSTYRENSRAPRSGSAWRNSPRVALQLRGAMQLLCRDSQAGCLQPTQGFLGMCSWEKHPNPRPQDGKSELNTWIELEGMPTIGIKAIYPLTENRKRRLSGENSRQNSSVTDSEYNKGAAGEHEPARAPSPLLPAT